MAVVSGTNKDANPISFSKLKKELLFHEKRLQLLSTRIVEDLESHLIEKSISRQECRRDCKDAIEAFQVGAADSKLSGRWDEHKVANLFGLEVPLDLVVGSSRFQAPAAADCHAIHELIEQLQVVGKRFPEFSVQGEEDLQGIQTLMEAIDGVEWGARDVTRMKEAISAKVAILTDLNDLANELQESNFEIGQLQSQLESLRRSEERAIEDGEMSLCDAVVHEKLQVLTSVIQKLLSQCQRIENAEEVNVTKRRSNIAVFQGASAMLEVLKTEKHGFVDGCKKDLSRIKRGVEYEDKATGSARRKAKEELDTSLLRINELDRRQESLSNRLLEIFKDFQETEMALEKVGAERAKVVADHVELVEDSRHIMSDMVELSRFAEVHAHNLEKTYQEYQRGLAGLEALDQVLLQKKGFDNYDFNAAARRLTSMQHTAALRLNQSLNDFEVQATELVRRQSSQLKVLDEEIDLTECEVEMRKDVFDPQTKKFVTKSRDLETKRNVIGTDLESLAGGLEQLKTMCMDTICRHLSQSEIETVEDRAAVDTLQRKEDLVDMRQELITPESIGIVGERAKLLVDRQSQIATTGRAQSPGASPAKLIEEKEKKEGVVTAVAPSRVLSVRDEVEKSKKLLEQLEKEAAVFEKERFEQEAAAHAAAQASQHALARKEKKGAREKRRVRVISGEYSP